ncbi:MAG: FtsX-like permease family protein [Pseudomonadota bacterium]
MSAAAAAARDVGAPRRFALTIRAFAAHWRRHPLQLVALLIGLAAATALWSGVQALNAEAKRSYAKAVALAGGEGAASLSAPAGGRFDLTLFAELRRAGWPVSPVLEGIAAFEDGAGAIARMRLLGVDPLSLPSGSSLSGGLVSLEGDAGLDFIQPPWRTLAAPETLRELGLSEGDAPRLATGGDRAESADARLPPLLSAPAAPPGALIVDMGAAEALLGAAGQVDRLLLDQDAPVFAADPEAAEARLSALLDGRLVLSAPPEADFERLSGSFHLNLTAFGLLSFAVGLFIAHGAIGLAFEQRRATLRTIRALGVSARMAAAAMIVELAALALIAGLAGLALGFLAAGWMAPDVAASLRGLYGAPVAGGLTFDPFWALSGLAMCLGGALLSAARSFWRAYSGPLLATPGAEAWRAAEARGLRRQALAGGALLLVALLIGSGLADGAMRALGLEGLAAGFILLGALMIGAALLLPALLAGALSLGRGWARGPLALWFWADARRELPGLSLALAALLIAAATTIGVGSMVSGFRAAFTEWLDRRLAAEIYAQLPSAALAEEARAWAEARPNVRAALPEYGAEIRLDGWPTELRGRPDHATFRARWRFIEAVERPWDRLAAGEAALISEQTARRLGLGAGDALTLPGADGPWRLAIAGVYADYGNPKNQITLGLEALGGQFPDADRTRLALRVAPEAIEAELDALRTRFALGEGGALDQNRIKGIAHRIFERTFAVTGALSALTFAVAGLALLTSLASLSGRRLSQLAPLWALGIGRRRLAFLDLAKTLMLAMITALAAIPLGMALAWCLVAVVNVEAFGWRLPLMAFPLDWAKLLALALIAAALASAPGALRLSRMAPERLLRLLAEER